MDTRSHLRVPKLLLDTGQVRTLQFVGETTNNDQRNMPAVVLNQQASDIMAFDSDDSEEEEEVISPGTGIAPEIRLQVDDVPMEEASSGETIRQ